ncbi:MAG: aminopeptidase N [Rhizomicrobium sp.]
MKARQTGLMRLADYRSPDFAVDTISLHFDLDASRTVIRNRMSLRRLNPSDVPLRLDGKALELISLSLNGELCGSDGYALDDEGLLLRVPLQEFSLEIVTAVKPAENKSALGLFELMGKLATQCEADGFRRITYFPDRPDVLARYEVTLVADKSRYPVLLSNGNPVARGDIEHGRHFVTWSDPFPKPCYIFAVIAGDFGALTDSFRTRSGREIALSIYADRDLVEGCRFAMEAVKHSLSWDEEVFGLEYDLDQYGIVALTGWPGATENKGLNLFGANGIVTNPETSTDDDYIIVERIVGHEQFHNWTGNRVTCRDWFQLSLKEGLTRFRDQLFAASRFGADACRIDNVKTLRRNQFPEDDGPAAHPIQPVEGASVSSFYTATVYDKGAEVVRMLIPILGWQKFRAGIDLYIARHDGQAVTTEDFLRSMEDASGCDLAQFRRWYDQAGRPRIAANGSYDGASGTYRLTLQQSCRAVGTGVVPRPFHIPVVTSLIGRDGSELAPPRTLNLTEPRQTFVFENVPAEPLPSLLRGFSAPVTVEADLTDGGLASLMARDSDPFVRWDSAQRLGIALIRSLAEAHRANLPMSVPATFSRAFGAILEDRETSDFLKAEIITVPDEPALSEGLQSIDLDALMAARAFLRHALAVEFEDILLALYHSRESNQPYSADAEQIAKRQLRNVCLDLLCARGTRQAARLCMAQMQSAANMTDQFAALCCLSHMDLPERQEAFAWFYDRWSHSKQAIDKWFNAQALSRAPGAADRIRALADHPKLDSNDLARGSLFFGAFFRQNRVAFHDPNGIGYRFLADRLLELDRLGRKNSHYLMPQINRWRIYDAHRRSLMKAELERVASVEGISLGLRENVMRALGSDH